MALPWRRWTCDAILRRKPQVVLVDELAHTNVPGSRNAKRYQDVQDILAAGIHVITTMNIQHLESLYDTVEKAAGVKVRERLPDACWRRRTRSSTWTSRLKTCRSA